MAGLEPIVYPCQSNWGGSRWLAYLHLIVEIIISLVVVTGTVIQYVSILQYGERGDMMVCHS